MVDRSRRWGIVLVLLVSLAGGCGRATGTPTGTPTRTPRPAPTRTAALETTAPPPTPALTVPVTPEASRTAEPSAAETRRATPTSEVPFEETPETAPAVAVPPKGTSTPASDSGAVQRRLCPSVVPVDREGQDHPSYPGWGRVINERYGFVFRYPVTWTFYNEGENYTSLCRGVAQLTVAYMRQGEDTAPPWTGIPAGDLVDLDPLLIQGRTIAKRALIYENKVKMLLYRVQVGDHPLTIRLDDVATPHYTDVDLPQALQEQADQIVGSLAPMPPQAARTKADRLLPGWVYRSRRGISASALWLVDEGGWSRRIATDPSALLSPDGRQLIAFDPRIREYRLRDRAAGASAAWRPLGETGDRDECCYRWWPERPGVLLFNSYPAGGTGSANEADLGGEAMGAVSFVNDDGTGYEVLDAPPILRYTAVAPSPDGRTLAYSDGNTGWLYRWHQGAAAFDPVAHGLAVVRDVRLYSPAWSPDGTRLAWVVSGELGAADPDWNGAQKSAVVVFDLPSRTANVLFRYHQARRGYHQPAPVWSPDGRWLAFEAWSLVADEEGMWVLQADASSADETSADEPVYLGPGSGPHWSPDSQWMAYTRVGDDTYVEDGTYVQDHISQIYVHKVRGGGAMPYKRKPVDTHLVDWIELAPGVQPAATATPPAAIAQGDLVLPAPCRRAIEGTSLYVNAVDGYCLRYPARFWVGDVYPPGIANLYGPPRDAYPLEPLSVGAALLVDRVSGEPSLSKAVDAWLERRHAEPPVTRGEGLLGGQPAELVEYRGERSWVKVVFALYESRLYALSFYPDVERIPQLAREAELASDAEALWDTAIGTFAFLPPETQAALAAALCTVNPAVSLVPSALRAPCTKQTHG